MAIKAKNRTNRTNIIAILREKKTESICHIVDE